MAARRLASERRTESLLFELLDAQGWDSRRPPNGEVLRQHEYRAHSHLREVFATASKTGSGSGVPEAILVDRASVEPLAVIEAKANVGDLDQASTEAKAYARHCLDAGFETLAIGIAGEPESDFDLRVFKWRSRRWIPITYDANPITWIPNRDDLRRIAAPGTGAELRPTVPPPNVLAARADEINRLLREARIKDEYRPAAVGAAMLALWSSRGNLRKEEPHVLGDINAACARAFWRAGKADLADSLRVDEANSTLAVKARRILGILELLNVATLTAEHDYLGQLYETFFRYTGGNTIGQYFTPRHITQLMTEFCAVGKSDVILDPACGTGGFLVSAMNRILETEKVSRTEVVKIIRDRLIGFEDEPVTAALCVANMILRGDGTTGVHRGDCFTDQSFPLGRATVGLMNPPFPHRKTDTPPSQFISRLLDGLIQRGRLATIAPVSLMVKMDGENRGWRERILRSHSLDAVVSLPDELFQPFAAANTVVLVLTRGVPHDYDRPVFFARIANDGLRLRKGVRLPRDGNQIPQVLDAYRNGRDIPNLCGHVHVKKNSEWAPGAYVPSRTLTDVQVLDEAASLIRTKTAMLVKYAPQLKRISKRMDDGSLEPREFLEYVRRRRSPSTPGTIGAYFEIFYGQKELETKQDLAAGDTLVISSAAAENGLYGFFDFDWVIAPPFVTVPRTGSIGHAHVQEWPCGATSDCLILVPRDGVSLAHHYVAAAVLRCERWRFNYGRKMTPPKIETFVMPVNDTICEGIEDLLDAASEIEARVLGERYDLRAEDRIDAEIAATRLRETEADPSLIVLADQSV